MVERMLKKDARKKFIEALFLSVCIVVLIICAVMAILTHTPGVLVLALFICSMDGVYAIAAFRSWWHCCQTLKTLKLGQNTSNPT